MLLYMAIGDGGILDNPVLQDLVFFYSFSKFIASPTHVKMELDRAKNLGFIEIDAMTSRVSLTEKGLAAANEHDVNCYSFMNPKFYTRNELEEKANKITDQTLVRQIHNKIEILGNDIEREGAIWIGPSEWERGGWEINSKPIEPAKKEIVVSSDLKITKAPPKPRKIG